MALRLGQSVASGSIALLAMGFTAMPSAYAAAPSSRGAGDHPDPAGNNGTIKIDDLPADAEHSNRPHPGCAFALKFFNFDSDQHADITFAGQAPTALGTLKTYKDRLISTSPADGAMEAEHTLVLSASDLGLLGTPQAKQGWHIKVSVDALNAPGGAKHKVFWLRCATGAAATKSTTPTAGGSSTESTASAAPASGSTTDVTGALAGVATAASSAEAAGSGSLSLSSSPKTSASTANRSGNGSSVAVAAVQPEASTAGRGSGLPFTGLPLSMLLAMGGAASAVGYVALRAGRRIRPSR